ncbi:peptidylprolyl isomerase [Candidatus Uhrbacteria bacterium]|jgi:cyclophilin family peptidyl-prolyl cis-trans isomerase|nr:peptidylprolyl isomerase [Candidatus Uhrbacteria bacterium]MBT7717258.1 peptidylprolyl isomerase [Candidatus Uhrbacteria bacterium]
MKYFYSLSLVLVAFVMIGAGCTETEMAEQVQPEEEIIIQEDIMTYSFPGVLSADQIEGKIVRISTEKGDITFELFADTAPKTVSNFAYLTGEGYYDGLTFHRREEGFVIQGGDPNGNGTGGPGYKFEDEVDDDYTYEKGIVAMANSGPNTNGSQFFIMLSDYALPKAYTIFGRVIEGQEIVDAIAVGDVMTTVTIESVGGEASEELPVVADDQEVPDAGEPEEDPIK